MNFQWRFLFAFRMFVVYNPPSHLAIIFIDWTPSTPRCGERKSSIIKLVFFAASVLVKTSVSFWVLCGYSYQVKCFCQFSFKVVFTFLYCHLSFSKVQNRFIHTFPLSFFYQLYHQCDNVTTLLFCFCGWLWLIYDNVLSYCILGPVWNNQRIISFIFAKFWIQGRT